LEEGVVMTKISDKTKKYAAYAVFVLLLCFIGVLCFYKLGVKYVDPWDEARHGVNAYEMLREKNLFQNTYLYEPDFYNLKPPLSMWCQVISFALFGANTFSLRAYSALCYLLLSFLVGRFVWKRQGALAGVLSLCFMAVNTTPFAAHMIRAGDADSLYVLLFSLSMLYMLSIPEKRENVYLCGLFFALAFLTKSYHAGVIAVIGGLFLLGTGEIKKLTGKNWLIFIVSCILPIALWAVPRLFTDGMAFFKEMLFTDVLGRTDGTLQNNIQPFSWYAQYYLGAMSGKLTVYLWELVIIVAGAFVFAALMSKEEWKKAKSGIMGYGLWIIVPFLMFSAVSNKLLWYLYPVTIPLGICAAIMLSKLIRLEKLPKVLRGVTAVAAVLMVVYFAKDVCHTIQSQTAVKGNEFQNLIQAVALELNEGDSDAQGETQIYAYVVHEPDAEGNISCDWAQQDVFVAEAYGDFKCRQEGVVGAKKEQEQWKQAVVFSAKGSVESLLHEFPEAKQITETEKYFAYIVE